MHETGAQWLMTSIEPSPEMVSAVRTCMAVPVFCLALPAGVWADRNDRRKWLISTQLLLLGIATIMASLAAANWLGPWGLLLLTAAMGVAMILNQPAWQALTPELVPPALVPSAVSAGSMSFNLARTLGPALAGLLIAQSGVWCTFLFNALSFLAVVIALFNWRPQIDSDDDDELSAGPAFKLKNSETARTDTATSSSQSTKAKSKPRFWDELRKGIFVVRNSAEVRNTLIRLFFFAVSASILWSLLSLVATQKLGFRETGFGFCLGIIGSGAVLGATVLPWLRTRLSSEIIVLSAQLVFSVLCIGIGLSVSVWFILPALFIVGTCWMSTMTTLNATAQVYLPRKFRARGMAAYIMFFALGMSIGSLGWGWLAYSIELGSAYVVAGVTLAISACLLHRLGIGELHRKPE